MTTRIVRCAATLVVLVTLGASSAHAAGDASGTAAASFLSLGNGASALSMAGATLAGGADLASAAWNPASLARLDRLQFSFTHAPLPGGATQEWFAAGGRVGTSPWTRWGVQTVFQREGGIEGRDASNNPTGTLSASDLAVGVKLAHRFAERVDVGVGGEWVHQSLAGVSGSGFALEAGIRGDAGPFGLALAARHVGGGMSWDGVRYDLPAVIAVGGSWSDAARGLRVNADLESPSHYHQALRLGGEWMWRGHVALRAGYRSQLGAPESEQLSGPTFGIGTGVGTMWMDYGFAVNGADGAGQHRIGLTFRPGMIFGGGLAAQPGHPPQAGPAPREPKPAPVKVTTREPERKPEPEAKPVVKKEAAKPEATSATATKPASEPAGNLTPGPMPVMPPAPAKTEPAAPPAASAPATGAAPAETPAPKPQERPATVVLGQNETLADVARRWGTTVPSIMMLNNLVSERVRPGTRLKLPPSNKR
jgi:LysM repeat protein